jgi:hypothetical protein
MTKTKSLNAVCRENQKKYAVGNKYGTYSYHCALKRKRGANEEAVKTVTKKADKTFETSNQSNKLLMETCDCALLGCDTVHIVDSHGRFLLKDIRGNTGI